MDAPRLMRLLSNEINLQILSILRSGSFNPRELARILQRDETDISRRLRKMEKAGLVEGKWIRINGKNVRVYSLRIDEIRISFEPGKVSIRSPIKDQSYEVQILEGKIPEVETFFGRRREISLLRSRNKNVLVIYGIAGIGKTTLAAKVFSDAFWYQMNEADSFEYFVWQIGLFLNTLGYGLLLEYLRSGGRAERDIFELTLEGMEETRATLVIDDLHRCSDEKILGLISFLAEKLKESKLVLISREKPSLGLSENILYLPLEGLDVEAAYRFLEAKGLHLDSGKFGEVYRLTKGHPLAMAFLAEAFKAGAPSPEENLFEFLFNEVYRGLTEEERTMLNVFSLFDEPLEYQEVKNLYPRKSVFAVLYSLLNKGLIERRGDFYFVHDLIKNLVLKVGGMKEDEKREYYSRHIKYLLGKNNARDFLRAFRYTVRMKDDELIKQLVEERIRRFKRIIQDFPDSYMKLLVEIKENPYALKELAHVYFQKGFFEKALRLWLKVKDELEGINKADALSSLVDVYTELNRFEEAEKHLKELGSLSRELNEPEVDFWYYVELTKFKSYKGDAQGALESAFKELGVVRKLKLPEQESLVLLHIGDIYTSLERFGEALGYYLQALEFAKAYSLSFMEHLSEMELAKAYYNLGDYDSSVKYGTRAGEYFLKVRNYRRAVDALAYRCVSYIGLRNLDSAEKDAEEMIKIAQSTGYPLGWAGYLFLAAVRYLKGEDWKEYMETGKEKLGDYPWLYSAVLDELEKVVAIPSMHSG